MVTKAARDVCRTHSGIAIFPLIYGKSAESHHPPRALVGEADGLRRAHWSRDVRLLKNVMTLRRFDTGSAQYWEG